MKNPGFENYKNKELPRALTPIQMYRELAKLLHPDNGGIGNIEEEMKKLNEAKEEFEKGKPEKLIKMYYEIFEGNRIDDHA